LVLLLWLLGTAAGLLTAGAAEAGQVLGGQVLGGLRDGHPPGPGAAAGRGRPLPVPVRPGGASPLLRPFAPPPVRWAAGHRGVDLAAAPGDRVRAPAGGTVSFAGRVAGRGVVAVVLDGSGGLPLRTTFEPVDAVVAAGERVSAGQLLGTVEESGPGSGAGSEAGGHCGVRSCLHWGLLRGEVYLDPLFLLGRARSRLYPLN
jgi:murein DD-endopeptidase MepM/ murein hydrolase activator NlpD